MTAKQRQQPSVHLVAYDSAGRLVQEQDLSWREYCERSHPLLDDAAYRKTRDIVRLSGTIIDAHGQNSEEFEAQFDRAGLCIADAARFADGSVLGNWTRLHG